MDRGYTSIYLHAAAITVSTTRIDIDIDIVPEASFVPPQSSERNGPNGPPPMKNELAGLQKPEGDRPQSAMRREPISRLNFFQMLNYKDKLSSPPSLSFAINESLHELRTMATCLAKWPGTSGSYTIQATTHHIHMRDY